MIDQHLWALEPGYRNAIDASERLFTIDVMPSELHRDSAALRSATGLDQGARSLILRVAEQMAAARQVNLPVATLIVSWYFEDRHGGVADYLAAVESSFGYGARGQIEHAVGEARAAAEFPDDLRILPTRLSVDSAGAAALLYAMPEPDFLTGVDLALRHLECLMQPANESRQSVETGDPWRFDPEDGWCWVGDSVVEEEVLRPALSALHDRRFAGSVRNEFGQARVGLRGGTRTARKQALTEAAKSVESAMKVVLASRNIPYESSDGAQRLFKRLVDAHVVAADTECLILSAPRPRNKRGAHGDGPVEQEVGQDEAGAFVAAAATAIYFLHKLLP